MAAKKPAKKKKSNAGRKPKIKAVTLRKLETAFKWGATDEEACIHAGIVPSTLYKYQKENPEFSERKKAWKENPVLKSRKTVFDAIKKGCVQTARWYLERKRKDEFSTKTETSLYGDPSKPPVQHEVTKKPATLEEAERAYLDACKRVRRKMEEE